MPNIPKPKVKALCLTYPNKNSKNSKTLSKVILSKIVHIALDQQNHQIDKCLH